MLFISVTGFTNVGISFAQTAPATAQCAAGDTLYNAPGGATFCYNTPANGQQCAAGYNLTSLPGQSNVCVTNSAATNSKLEPSSCSIWWGTWTFSDCIWVPLMAWLGSWFLAIGGGVLQLAGLIFDALVNGVIIGFGQTLNTLKIMPLIKTGWTLFRDLSNILIIGMFVFIAIATILGIKEYGYKRLVARVLIIAVLMNFSLLFTELIVDVSNFTAFQFYASMTNQNSQTGVVAGSQFDIAQAFIKPMGLTSVWQGSGTLTQNIGALTGSGVQAFFFGLIGGILLLIVGGILFYGAILIAARAVVIVVLMLTASVAFTTYLIPNFAEGEYGWKGWWKALINCAVFAPLLMLFLSLSIVILQATNLNGATLSGVIANPSQLIAATGGAWNIIIIYIFGVGLLFVSLKISSQFASMASGVALSATLAPIAIGSRVAGGMFAQRFIARPAAEREVAKKEEVRRAQSELKNLNVGTDAYDKKAAEIAQLRRAVDKAGQQARAPSAVGLIPTVIQRGLGRKDLVAGKTPATQKNAVATAEKKPSAEAAAGAKPPAQPVQTTAGVPASDNAAVAKQIRESVNNLTETVRATGEENAQALQKVGKIADQRTAAPVTESPATNKLAQEVEQARQHSESENRSRLNSETEREKNALEEVIGNRSANRTAIDEKLATGLQSNVRVLDMINRVRQQGGSSGAVPDAPQARNMSLQPDVPINDVSDSDADFKSLLQQPLRTSGRHFESGSTPIPQSMLDNVNGATRAPSENQASASPTAPNGPPMSNPVNPTNRPPSPGAAT